MPCLYNGPLIDARATCGSLDMGSVRRNIRVSKISSWTSRSAIKDNYHGCVAIGLFLGRCI